MVGLALLVGVAATGCLSPTLPLPPPYQPSVSKVDGEGYVTVQGGAGAADPGAVVYGYDQQNGHGAIDTVGGSGQYLLRMQATAGDKIIVWQEQGSDRSPAITVTVPR